MNSNYAIIKNEIKNIERSIQRDSKKIKELKRKKNLYEKSKNIIYLSIYEIQSKFQSNIETTVNSVLNYIWDEIDFRFEIKAKERVDSFEWQPKLFDGDVELSLKPSTPEVGAPINIIGVVFKIIFHLIKNKRNILFFDEPAANLGNRSQKFGDMIKFLNEKFKTQIIISTHDRNLWEMADFKYEIKKKNKISHIKKIG